MKKKSKQKFSDAMSAKPAPKKLNPFEMHVNRRKYDVLGMKSKAERGLPGVSRSRAIRKRIGTLLQEYKYKDKNNLFVDRRIGERNSAMTAEDKILARYTAERMKFHSKKSIYNLGDDEELTHKGQTLSEIEKFDDPKSDDEDDEEEDGKLGSDFVEDAHFGGGIFKKVEGESKSRKNLIDQLIAESIKRKAEKQKLRQETLDLTQKLDSDWKELLPLVTASKKTKTDPEPDTKKDDKFANYDVLSKKLRFESRGKPSDRLKSEEEIAKEEKEKLEQLERDRIQRMMGETEKDKNKHRSADDMDDGFDIGNEPETVLSYKDGALDKGENEDTDSDEELTKEEKDEIRKGMNRTENGTKEDKEDSDDEEGGSGEEEEDNEDGSEDDGDDSVNLSDMKETDESDVEESEKPETVKEKPKMTEEKPEVIDADTEKDATEKAKAMEAARKELPYTFNIPKEYEEFEKLMKDHDSDFQAVIIERMIKCHHPSLNQAHKDDLDMLYAFMLQHLQDCAIDPSTKIHIFKVLDRLAPWFYDLTQWNPENCASGLMEVIEEKYQEFLKKSKSFPSVDTLVFLKLISILFSTSDFRHKVVTPALLFMQQTLFQCTVQSSIDLSIGLFITTLAYEYCALSKRFVPEAINFLYNVLRLVHPKDSNIPIRLPSQPQFYDSFNLNIEDKTRNFEPTKLSVSDLVYTNSSDEFKINATSLALTLLSRFCEFWNGEPAAFLIFERFVPLLDSNQFSQCLKKGVEDALEKISEFQTRKLKKLTMERRKPKPLKLYEPNIEEVYSLKKYKPMGKKKTEHAKLVHKYKREMKGALREIRRDRAFLSKLKHKETVKSDIERRRKVKEIFGAAAEQMGELRKLQRKKK